MNYVIVDRKTGAWDGIYRTYDGASDALRSLKNRIPAADWDLQVPTSKPDPNDFWLNIYNKEMNPKGEQA
jgi:hypothetical protein